MADGGADLATRRSSQNRGYSTYGAPFVPGGRAALISPNKEQGQQQPMQHLLELKQSKSPVFQAPPGAVISSVLRPILTGLRGQAPAGFS